MITIFQVNDLLSSRAMKPNQAPKPVPCGTNQGVKTMLVFEFNASQNSWILVSETKSSFYDHIEVTYFN